MRAPLIAGDTPYRYPSTRIAILTYNGARSRNVSARDDRVGQTFPSVTLYQPHRRPKMSVLILLPGCLRDGCIRRTAYSIKGSFSYAPHAGGTALMFVAKSL